MLNPQFHTTAKDYIKTLIAQRRYLIRTGKSKANAGFINDCLAELDKYMKAYQYDNDYKMATFYSNHSSEIYALIPGKNSGSHEPSIKVFFALLSQAKQISGAGELWWQSILTVSPN